MPTVVKFEHRDGSFKQVKTIEVTEEKVIDVLATETHYPLASCYQYNITNTNGSIITLDSYNNCLFD